MNMFGCAKKKKRNISAENNYNFGVIEWVIAPKITIFPTQQMYDIYFKVNLKCVGI